ncbi:hypothetical protein GIB67_031462 [Kingdonia uniflora]|uniref:RNase H type-1 domain-containing protein n=1 Tax=Kingdonia uniflora TaxID=39325 RepID=A0A7J7MBI6_9MAGN|nr:hypothetical protein GIB67_031462 [Kingdonia uniflora]
MKQAQTMLHVDPLNNELSITERQCVKDYSLSTRKEEPYLKQKSRIDNAQEIGEKVIEYFKGIFGAEHEFEYDREVLKRVHLPIILDDTNHDFFGEDVTGVEITPSLTSIRDDKAPRPDRYSANFFKCTWSITGIDFTRVVSKFFRLITCNNVVCKCISKILTTIIKLRTGKIIGDNQFPLISGRSIQDNVMIFHDLVRNYHRDNGPASAMHTYWTASFVLPQRVITEINSLCKRFLWAGVDLSPIVSNVSWTKDASQDIVLSIGWPCKRIKLSSQDIELQDIAKNRDIIHDWSINASFVMHVPTKVKWGAAIGDIVTLNTDGSYKNGKGGSGAMLRNNSGTVLGTVSGTMDSNFVPMLELNTIEMGLRCTVEKGHKKVLVGCDSNTVVGGIKNMNTAPWETINKIRQWITQLGFFDIVHIFRETNGASDSLAGLHPDIEYVEIIQSSFSEDLNKNCYEDEIGNAIVYTVGDATGWTLMANYNTWISGTFATCGTLGGNIVDEVSANDYASWTVENSISSNSIVVTSNILNTHGLHYFICDVGTYPSISLKIELTKLDLPPS